MAHFEVFERSDLTFRQIWSHWLTMGVVGLALLGGFLLREQTLGSSVIFDDPVAGFTVRYPNNWILDQSDEYILRVSDPRALGFKTRLQVSIIPIGPETSAHTILDSLTFNRARRFPAYRVLDVETVEYEQGRAVEMLYTLVDADVYPFLEQLPSIVLGRDAVFLRGRQAFVITFQAEAGEFEQQRFRFDDFINSLVFE